VKRGQPVLEAQKAHDSHDIVNMDEPWFHFSMVHKGIELATVLPVPDREWHMIQVLELMITVI
jgi:molybdopterin-biosynthesis enzyme MoeA-like protein